MRRVLARAVMVTGSLALSLVLAEALATWRAGGAYPFLNLFVPDAEMGVRLSPNASTRIRSRLGRITRIQTDAAGRRVHPVGDRGRILLLGDSQAFGYHVEADQAVASQLAERTGAEVVDAAVPSYGPHEYAHLAERLVPRLEPDLVVLVLNLANDWWEVNVPNTRRSAAHDGWLVSASGRRESPLDFPGRSLLFGRSHLVLALRQVAAHAAAKPRAAIPERLLRDASGFRAERFLPFLERVKSAGAPSLLVVLLPIDVMADETAWAKYRGDPVDTRALDGLLADVADACADRGIDAVDLLGPLRRVAPGAFLDDDPHLSPRGHQVFAAAIAARFHRERLAERSTR